MDNLEPTIDDEVKGVEIGAPRVVILGAGASRAVIPDGDKNGNKLPLMDDLIDFCNLRDDFKKYSVELKD